MKKVHQKARVHGSLILMGVTIIGLLYMARVGRKAAERGESIAQMNEDWHKEQNQLMKAAGK